MFTQHLGVRVKTGWLGITITCIATCLLMDGLKKSKSRDKQNHNSNKQDKIRETQMYKLTKNTKDRTMQAPLKNKGITMTHIQWVISQLNYVLFHRQDLHIMDCLSVEVYVNLFQVRTLFLWVVI